MTAAVSGRGWRGPFPTPLPAFESLSGAFRRAGANPAAWLAEAERIPSADKTKRLDAARCGWLREARGPRGGGPWRASRPCGRSLHLIALQALRDAATTALQQHTSRGGRTAAAPGWNLGLDGLLVDDSTSVSRCRLAAPIRKTQRAAARECSAAVQPVQRPPHHRGCVTAQKRRRQNNCCDVTPTRFRDGNLRARPVPGTCRCHGPGIGLQPGPRRGGARRARRYERLS